MEIIRTRFKNDIVAEVAIPSRKSSKIVILCPGMPSGPSKGSFLTFLAENGYWAILPRYRGSWESAGTFLKQSPEQDVLDVLDEIPNGFSDSWSGTVFHLPAQAGVKPKQIYLLGGSFGGPAALLASRDPRVNAVVAISPVVDWQAPSKAEPLDWLKGFVEQAFGEGYRFTGNTWKKLAGGAFYNPVRHTSEIDGSKVLIFHAKDDESVLYKPVERFARNVGAKTKFYKRGGHLGLSFCMRPVIWRQIERFFKAHEG